MSIIHRLEGLGCNLRCTYDVTCEGTFDGTHDGTYDGTYDEQGTRSIALLTLNAFPPIKQREVTSIGRNQICLNYTC